MSHTSQVMVSRRQEGGEARVIPPHPPPSRRRLQKPPGWRPVGSWIESISISASIAVETHHLWGNLLKKDTSAFRCHAQLPRSSAPSGPRSSFLRALLAVLVPGARTRARGMRRRLRHRTRYAPTLDQTIYVHLHEDPGVSGLKIPEEVGGLSSFTR